SAVARIDPRLHVLRQFHSLVPLVRNSLSGHGLSGFTGSGWPKSSLVPSAKVMLASGLAALSACSIMVLMLGLRGLRWRCGLGTAGARSCCAQRSITCRYISATAA